MRERRSSKVPIPHKLFADYSKKETRLVGIVATSKSGELHGGEGVMDKIIKPSGEGNKAKRGDYSNDVLWGSLVFCDRLYEGGVAEQKECGWTKQKIGKRMRSGTFVGERCFVFCRDTIMGDPIYVNTL